MNLKDHALALGKLKSFSFRASAISNRLDSLEMDLVWFTSDTINAEKISKACNDVLYLFTEEQLEKLLHVRTREIIEE